MLLLGLQCKEIKMHQPYIYIKASILGHIQIISYEYLGMVAWYSHVANCIL